MLDKWPSYFKAGGGIGSLQAAENNTRQVMKIAPVPLFTVIDGLERDLEAVDVYERLQFLADIEPTLPAYMAHAMRFCTSAMTKYTSAAKRSRYRQQYLQRYPHRQTSRGHWVGS